MTQTEALRLALEALNYAWGYGTQRLDDKLTKVIPAIKEALAHPEQEPKKLPENAARLIIGAWIYRNYGCGYDYHLSDQDEGTSWMWWINSHPYEDPDAAVGFDGGSCWIDFEGKISDHTIIPDAFNSRLQTITHLEQPKEPEQEPVAYLVMGPYEKTAFSDIGSANAYCRGLNKGFGADAYIVSPLYTTPPQPKEPEQEPVALNLTIEGEAAKYLSAMLVPALDGDDPTAIRLMIGEGHSGYGLYVANDEYPEEGAELLVNIIPPQHKPWVTTARAAISKATGEQK